MWVVIAALAAIRSVVVGLAAIEAARRWNRSASARDEKVARALTEIAEDVDHVRALTEGAIEEARRREQVNVPRPRLVALVDHHEADALRAALRAPRSVEVEELLRAALEKAAQGAPKLPSRGPYGMAMFGIDHATERDVEDYEREIEEYGRRLHEQLDQLRAYEDERARLVIVHLRIHNDGLVPLEDARLVVRLPEDLEARTHISRPPTIDEVPALGVASFPNRYSTCLSGAGNSSRPRSERPGDRLPPARLAAAGRVEFR